MSDTLIRMFGILFNNVVLYLLFFMFLFRKEGKSRSKKIYALSFAGVIALSMMLNYFQVDIFNLISNVCAYLFISLFVFRCDLKKSVIYTVTFLGLGICSHFISIGLFSYVFNLTALETLADTHMVVMENCTNALFMFILYHVISSLYSRNEKNQIRPEEVFMYIFIMFLEIFIFIEYTVTIIDKYENIKLFIILFGFLFIDVYFIVAMQRISESSRVKHENQLLQKQNEIQLAHYRELEKNYTESRKVIHDIKKHLATLSELKSEDPEKAEQYRRMIENDVDSLAGGFSCTNRILSIVMSQKITAAESQGIEVLTDIEDVGFTFMNDLDITAIFANLWDNAIEACAGCTSKRISVNIETRNSFVLINFTNSFSGVVDKTGNNYNTTKEGHSGVGLTIIRSTVEKYGGLVNIESDNTDFTVEITLPVPLGS